MKLIMTQRELDRRLGDVRTLGEDAIRIEETAPGSKRYVLVVSVGNGDETIPVEIVPG